MTNAHLTHYLNDHLAGSVVALELLQHLEKAYAGTQDGDFFSHLHTEVAADRQELEHLMQRLGVSTSLPRQAVAWLAEKATQVKLGMEDREKGPFYLVEALEAIEVGVEGKRSLWQNLATAALPALEGTDFNRLEQRALEQLQSLEVNRREAARTAFGSDTR